MDITKVFMDKAAKRMKKWADEKRRPRNFWGLGVGETSAKPTKSLPPNSEQRAGQKESTMDPSPPT